MRGINYENIYTGRYGTNAKYVVVSILMGSKKLYIYLQKLLLLLENDTCCDKSV